jgi:hypothetical protein
MEDDEVRNEFEVAHVMGSNAVAELKRRHPDQEIGERDTNALRLSLTVDLARP